MKFLKYPPFRITGRVSVTAKGAWGAMTTMTACAYATNSWDASGAVLRAAKNTLQSMGVPDDKFDTELFLEYEGIESIEAVEPRGVKREYGVPVEGFVDYDHTPKKRATLIRQRRLLPNDLQDQIAIYDTAPAASANVQNEAVPA